MSTPLTRSLGITLPVVQGGMSWVVELDENGATPGDVQALHGRDRARLGCIEGEMGEGLCPAGSAVGLVRDVPTVAELLERIADEVRMGLKRLGATLR